MANDEHFAILRQGVNTWNSWREDNPNIQPDLRKADMDDMHLNGINLRKTSLDQATISSGKLNQANLDGANLTEANLIESSFEEASLVGAYLVRTRLHRTNFTRANFTSARLDGANGDLANLTRANLTKATLREVNFSNANLSFANLNEANLYAANLIEANLSGASLSNTNLGGAGMVRTNLSEANLYNCHIYGISAWDVNLNGTTISNLIITDTHQSEITVDNLEVAQVVYLLLNNEKLRDVISTLGKKCVLILGRFTPAKRKDILYAMREKLRQNGYVPIVFDFEKAVEKDFTETIKILAGMALFVIADITNPRSSPLELQGTVPDYMIPFIPLIQKGEEPFSMFVNLQNKYKWVMDVLRYDSKDQLIKNFESAIITPALDKHKELINLKNTELRIRDIGEA